MQVDVVGVKFMANKDFEAVMTGHEVKVYCGNKIRKITDGTTRNQCFAALLVHNCATATGIIHYNIL